MHSIPTRTRRIVVAGALALAAAVPTAAQAGTITYEGDALVYRAAPGEVNRTGPGEATSDPGRVAISDGYGITITSQTDRCIPVHDWFECEIPARMVFDVGDGDDDVQFGFVKHDIPVEVHAGDGADNLSGFSTSGKASYQLLDGGAGNDKIDGDVGNDVVRGGPGDDEVTGGSGNDTVDGGDGNDSLFPDGYDEPGTDIVDGGAGFDRIDGDYVIPGNAFNPPVAISFDGVANDGRPGENDNLRNVEKVDASVSGTFTGGPGADDFFVKADFHDAVSTVSGEGGNDKLVGHDHAEVIDGGPGDDIVEGGLNHDTLTGGPGKDTIFGDSTKDTCNFLSCRIAFGNDVIQARDGEQDTIDCGVGDDRATVDAIDVVANCEQVDAGGGAPGAGGGKLDGPKRYTRKALRKGIAIDWDCTAACTVKLTLTADKRTAKRLGTKVIASGKGAVAQAGTVKFRARLTTPARKRLGRLRKGRGTIAVAVTQHGAKERFTQVVALKR
jgi:Ca2+-binding RTX toxin-like protein